MSRHSRVIRIFVSSTFEDMKAERDMLQQGAFHRLREYCRGLGWQFQAVDLRWGINNEATIDQRTMEICLREIERCQEQSPRPNFILLLGERYGWRPLPDRILQSVVTEMIPAIPMDFESLFREWYELDENQLPEPVWCLKPRQGNCLEYDPYDKNVQKPLGAFFSQWAAEHLPDPDVIEHHKNLRALQRLKMERSATEQEIHAGALRVEDAGEHVFAFLRDLPAEGHGVPSFHDEDQRPVQRLRDNIIERLPESNRLDLTAGWDTEIQKPTATHLKELDDWVESFLKTIIDREIEAFSHTDEDELEEAAHAAFARERTFGFSGREKDLQAIRNYVNSTSKAPFVLWGASGTGKSTLLAQAAKRIVEEHPDAMVITRFIGVTGKSSNGHTLLTDLARRLCKAYGGKVEEIPLDPTVLEARFRDYLATTTPEKPLVLLIDALDQFSNGDPYRHLKWLPTVLPENVRIVLSTLEVDCLDILKQREGILLHEITPLTADDGRLALDAWLGRAGRMLRKEQYKALMDGFIASGCSPIWLHIISEQARYWKSSFHPSKLTADPKKLFQELILSLEEPKAHGVIVKKALSYLFCARRGLSDDELLGILARDDEVWDDFRSRSLHEYQDGDNNIGKRRLPPILWIRLYHDLEYYLTRRSAPGGEVIAFYHRQLAEVVDTAYLQQSGEKQDRHLALADFFQTKPWLLQESPELVGNARKCDELPFHLQAGGDWASGFSLFVDIRFLECSLICGQYWDLRSDLDSFTRAVPKNGSGKSVLSLLCEAMGRGSAFVERHAIDYPQCLRQTLMSLFGEWIIGPRCSYPEETGTLIDRITQSWATDLLSSSFKRCFEILTPNYQGLGASLVTEFPILQKPTVIAFNNDGNMIASGNAAGRVFFHDTRLGKMFHSFAVCSQPILSLHWIDYGRKLLTLNGNNSITLWYCRGFDIEISYEILVDAIMDIEVLPGEGAFLTISDNGVITLHEVTTGRVINELPSFKNVLAVKSTDAPSIIVICMERSVKLIDIRQRPFQFFREYHSPHQIRRAFVEGNRVFLVITSPYMETEDIIILDTKTLEIVTMLTIQSSAITSITTIAGSPLMFVGHGKREIDFAITFPGAGIGGSSVIDRADIECWNIINRKKICVFAGHTRSIRDLAVCNSLGLLASFSEDGVVRLWTTSSIPSCKQRSPLWQAFEEATSIRANNSAVTVELQRSDQVVVCIEPSSEVESNSLNSLTRKMIIPWEQLFLSESHHPFQNRDEDILSPPIEKCRVNSLSEFEVQLQDNSILLFPLPLHPHVVVNGNVIIGAYKGFLYVLRVFDCGFGHARNLRLEDTNTKRQSNGNTEC